MKYLLHQDISRYVNLRKLYFWKKETFLMTITRQNIFGDIFYRILCFFSRFIQYFRPKTENYFTNYLTWGRSISERKKLYRILWNFFQDLSNILHQKLKIIPRVGKTTPCKVSFLTVSSLAKKYFTLRVTSSILSSVPMMDPHIRWTKTQINFFNRLFLPTNSWS